MHELTDPPISPELALVSPELREQARERLSDRPWEDWRARPPGEQAPEPLPVARAPAAPHARTATPEAARAPTVRASPPGRRPAEPDRAETVPPQPGRVRPTRARPPAATVAGRVLALVLGGIVMAVAAAVYASEVRPPAASFEAGDERPGAAGSVAVPGAGPVPVDGDWVFGETGRFRVDGAGTTIAQLAVALGCARELELTAIPVDEAGRFTATAPMTHDSGRVSEVTVVGRFLDAWTAAVEIEVQGGACSSERLRAVARLK